jgi:PilZ domain
MHDQFANRRRSERHAVNGPGKIRIGSMPRDCRILDVSKGGARVVAAHIVAALPAEFALIMPDGRSRECRLAWQIGCEFGVEFIGGHPDEHRFRAA